MHTFVGAVLRVTGFTLSNVHNFVKAMDLELMDAINARGLTKRYGDTLALDRLDLAIAPGEVYGYLGPNGAGKTTTIRLMLGLHRPTGATRPCSEWMRGGIRLPHTVGSPTSRANRRYGRR